MASSSSAPTNEYTKEDVFYELKTFVNMFIEIFKNELNELKHKAAAPAHPKSGKEYFNQVLKIIKRNVHSEKMKRITKLFKFMDEYCLRQILANAAGKLFRCFESQFMQISSSDSRGLEKLAVDAVTRIFHYIDANNEEIILDGISPDLFARAIIQGESEAWKILKREGIKTNTPLGWRTSHVFRKVGLYDEQEKQYYTSKNCDPARYGYRLVLDSERIPEKFVVDRDPKKSSYKCVLTQQLLTEYIERIIEEMKNYDPKEIAIHIKKTIKSICTRIPSLKILHRNQTILNVLTPVATFIGRKDELEDIRTKLEEGNRFKVVAINGLGGIGKSELARKYAFEYFRRDNTKDSAIWIDSETPEGIKASFHDVAKQLKIETTEKCNQDEVDRDIKDIARDVYKYFVDRRCLLIFDNAESLSGIKNVMPWRVLPGEVSPYVLITSRCRDWDLGQEGKIEVISLTELSSEEAMVLVKTSLEIDNDNQDHDDKINELTQQLFCFPLALSQAVAYIKQKRRDSEKWGETYAISDYIREYKSNIKDEKTKLLTYPLRTDMYTETIYTTWQLRFKKFEEMGNVGEIALQVLNVMAYLAPDDIPVERYFVKEDVDKTLLRNAIEKLEEYSIVRIHRGVVNVNHSVQDVLRMQLKNAGQDEIALRNALNIEFCLNKYDDKYRIDHVHLKSAWSAVTDYKSLISECILKSDEEYRQKLVGLLAEFDMHEAIRSVIECLKQHKIPNYILRMRALSEAIDFGSKNVVKYLKPFDTQIILEAHVMSFFLYNDFNGLKKFLEELDSNPKRSEYLKKLDLTDLIKFCRLCHADKLAGIKLLLANGASLNLDDFFPEIGTYKVDDFLDIFNFLSNDSPCCKPKREHLLRALIEAIGSNNFEVCKLLLDHDPSLVDLCNHSQNISELYKILKNVDILSLLLEHGLDINKTGPDGDHLIVYMARNGSLNMCKFILESTELNTKVLQEAFIRALNGGHFETCQLLMDHGAELSNDEGINYYDLAEHRSSDILNLLINRDFDVNKPDEGGKLLLNCAAEKGNVELCQFLIERGADCNITDRNGKNALHAACAEYFSNSGTNPGKFEICELLIDHQVNVNATDLQGKTPLMAIIELMKNHKDSEINEATKEVYMNICRLLLRNEAEVNVADNKDKTAWKYAVNSKTPYKLELCYLLLQRGVAVDVNYANSKGETLLFDVVRYKHLRLFDPLCDRGANLNSKNFRNDTPLHIVARCGHPDFCKKFLEHNADLNVVNKYGYTPLRYTIQCKHFEVFEILLNGGACKEASKKTWESLLDEAIEYRNSEIGELFLNSYINNNVSNDTVSWSNLIEVLEIRSPIFIAVRFGLLSICKKLLELGADLRRRNENDETLLHVAVCYNHFNVCQLLINHLVSINLTNKIEETCIAYINAPNKDGKTPLALAARRDCADICELLLNHGADPNKCDKNNISPLHYAATYDNMTICKLLIDRNANVDVKIVSEDNKYSNISGNNVRSGDTPLHVAAQYDSKNVCKLLINSNAGINEGNKDNRTPLYLATLKRNLDVCHLLLSFGANTNICDKNQQSLLHLVSDYYKRDINCAICEILIYFSADINAINKKGNTPLNSAVQREQRELCELLLEFGADPSIANEDGFTPLHSAVLRGNLKICKLILSSAVDIHAVDKNGRTALHLCAQRYNRNFDRAISGENMFDFNLNSDEALDSDACTDEISNSDINSEDIDDSDISSEKFLDSDEDSDTVHICELLLTEGAKVNALDIHGKTALNIAVLCGDFEICNLLLHHGADFSITDKDELSPLELSKKHSDIHQLFINWKRTKQQLPA